MLSFREMAKRWLPAVAKDILRAQLLPPPEEDVVLHDYEVVFEPSTQRRLSLVIPSIAPGKAYGGVMTGVELFFQIGKQTGADLRIVLDDPKPSNDISIIEKRAQALDLRLNEIEIMPRRELTPTDSSSLQ